MKKVILGVSALVSAVTMFAGIWSNNDSTTPLLSVSLFSFAIFGLVLVYSHK